MISALLSRSRQMAASLYGHSSEGFTGYRPDVDGLRALAVLSVVVYHLDKDLVPGGFTGVDIFFVISGFLITGNIWNGMRRGEFSLVDFYVRRIRRIAPAFFVMLAAVLVAGCILLLPPDVMMLAKSSLWATFSASNVYFWKFLDHGYFAAASDQVPLLHTWSLAVEEQFYLIWPLLLMLLFRGQRKWIWYMVPGVILVGSFVLAEASAETSPEFAYYMLPTRAGEMLVGAVLALWISGREEDSRDLDRGYVIELLAMAGLAALFYGLYGLDDASKFPGANALFPCLGAGLIIYAGGRESTLVRLVFSSRPVVYIGLLSYSLYLWHWPVFAYFRYFQGELVGFSAAMAVAIIAVASWLSYRFVEVPARYWRSSGFNRVVLLYGIPVLCAAAFSGWLVRTQGMKDRIEASPSYQRGARELAKYVAPAYEFRFNCQLSEHQPAVLSWNRCVVGRGTGEARVLLWGDSHAAHYVGLLKEVADKHAFLLRSATHSSCPPVFGGEYGIAEYRRGCSQYRPYIEDALSDERFSTVIMGASWATYDDANFRRDLERTIRKIASHGSQVVLLGQVPYFRGYNRECELRAIRIGGADCRGRLSYRDSGESSMNRYLAQLAGSMPNVHYVSIRSAICQKGVCTPYLSGHPIYYDGSHLSMEGSRAIGRKLLAAGNGSEQSELLKPLLEALTVARERQQQGLAASVPPRSVPPLQGIYVPGFPHRARALRNPTSKIGPAGAVLEVREVALEEAMAVVERDLVAKGYKLSWRGKAGEGERLEFKRQGTARLSVRSEPPNGRISVAPGTKGVIYVYW